MTWEREPNVSREGPPPSDLHTRVRPSQMGQLGASLEVVRLRAANVPPNTRAGEAARLVLEHELNRAADSMTFDVETEGVWED